MFHRIDDIEVEPMSLIATRVPYLPAYGGALAQALQAERMVSPQLQTAHPQALSTAGDTPPDIVDAMRVRALLESFPPEMREGGVTKVSPDDLRRELSNGR